MSSVAEQLRTAREARNLSIDQVAELTKIRTDHVRALEEGNFDAFSAPIYIRGSVKNYATMLKLDVRSVLTTLDTELKGTQQFREPPPLVEQRKTILDSLTLVLAKLNWRAAFVVLLMLVTVVGTVFGVVSWLKHKKTSPANNLPPAVYQPGSGGDTLALPKH